MITVKGLSKSYDNGLVKALKGISFEVAKGEYLAIMGPSGCGKSTLLNLIGALDEPTDGEISIDGKNITDYRPYDRFRSSTVGFVFQLHHLVPALTLLENVELPMYSLRCSGKDRRARAAKVLEDMGLADRMHFLPNRVSGGEKQRAAIARAVVNGPRIILADEPTGNVDTSTGERILDILTCMCRLRNVTMILATHDRSIAERADRIIHIRDGFIEGG